MNCDITGHLQAVITEMRALRDQAEYAGRRREVSHLNMAIVNANNALEWWRQALIANNRGQ